MVSSPAQLKKKRENYAANVEDKRAQARLRAQRCRESLSDEERQHLLKRHREVQVRYRKANRSILQARNWQYRQDKKVKVEQEKDEREFTAFMAENSWAK